MKTLCVLLSLLFLASCQQQDKPRHYSEIVSETSPENAGGIRWTLPAGWKQGPAKPMRVASFYLQEHPEEIDCSIVILAGNAGGVESNLRRWMRQINVPDTDDNLQKAYEGKRSLTTQGGLEAVVFDLSALKDKATDNASMDAMIAAENATIFVKMTGTIAHLEQYRAGFWELLQSLGSQS